MPDIYIGLMSGTSMDGIDAAVVDFSQKKIQLLAHHSHPIPEKLKHTLMQLALDKPLTSLDDLGQADAELGDCFAEATLALLEKTELNPDSIKAIGSHGQTIRHRPDAAHPFSMQIGNANQIAQKTGITTVADFRGRDIAAGGEGAPLTPAFHRAMFTSPDESRGVVNIGGISNITYLPANSTEACIGFDCGPGNMLMDAWIRQHLGRAYDEAGAWASSSEPNEALVAQLMHDPFIQKQPPKSTGREHYNLEWLNQQLKGFDELKPETIQASLCEFTAQSIQLCVEKFLPEIKSLMVCGGGAHNTHLMQRLQVLNPGISLNSSEKFGLHPDWVEAVAFAWLAKQTMEDKTGNLPEVTGASQPVILGAIYK